MTRRRRLVTREPGSDDRLPDFAGLGALTLLELSDEGTLDEVGRRLRIRREGGFAGLDLFVFLLLYFCSGLNLGLKRFCRMTRPWSTQLAALGCRSRLPSSASASRMLSATDIETVRELGNWLLIEASGVLDVLRHPWVRTRDAQGKGWHVFERDGRVWTLRHRALPRGDELPEAARRSEEMATAGYAGRKRGDVQFHRSTLQHAGSGAYLNVRLAPGNGERRPELAADLQVLCDLCDQLGISRDEVLLRQDGEFGWVPDLTACREAGIPCITRVTRPELFNQTDVRARLAAGTWEAVPDSLSGPRRSAMDLGTVTLRPGRTTVRDDGTPYAPLDVRVVVSRYPRTGKAEHGRVLDGWQYELFAALDLEAAAWPASDVVCQYFGRAGQENRFHQEDREVHLERIFSYSLAGQQLATTVGLFTWNRALARGFGMAPPDGGLPDQPPREPVCDDRPVPLETTVPPPVQKRASPPPAPHPQVVAEQRSLDEAQAVVAAVLDGVNWSHRLRRRAVGWRYRPGSGVLTCPADQDLMLASVGPQSKNRGMRAQFLAPAGTCTDCSKREGCLSSARPDACKLTAIPVDEQTATALKGPLERLIFCRRRLRSATALPTASTRPRRAPARPMGLAPPVETPALPHACDGPFLAPAVARRRFREACRTLVFDVRVEILEAPPPDPLFLPTSARRQRRRRTWTENLARFALPPASQLSVIVRAPAATRNLLGLPHTPATVVA